MEEKLVAVTTLADGDDGPCDNDVYVDWGPDFTASHHAAFPDVVTSVVSTNYGPLAMDYI